MNGKTRRIEAEDLYLFQTIAGCDMSPDGRHAVYSVQRVNRENQKRYADLWIADVDGGQENRFTRGDWLDTGPRWSPDGSAIAFLSDRDKEGEQQIYIIALGGGEARKLTDLKGWIGNLDWSPDGTRIAFEFRGKDQDASERERDDDKKTLGVVQRHIKRVYYRLDGVGFWPDERQHLAIVAVETGAVQQLTDGDLFDEHDPCWTPDGGHILFASNRSDDPDFNPDLIDLFVVLSGGGELRKIETPSGPKGLLSVSPDGRWVAFVGHEGANSHWRNSGLSVVPLDGKGSARNLTGGYDIAVGNDTISERGDGPTTRPAWSPDSGRLYFQVTHHGNTSLYSATLDGALDAVLDHDAIVGEFSLDRSRSTAAWVDISERSPCEIHTQNFADTDKGRRRVSRRNVDLMDSLELGDVDQVRFQGPAGDDLQGWILKPPGFDVSEKYPSILQIHGGPWAQYGNALTHEFQYLAAQGYVVYYCNPRGGRGYGEKHAKAIWRDWGNADYDDVMAWADYLQAKPYIDDERMGVTGGSYGGYMTNWIIGHTDRFKAAVTQRSVVNLVDFYGTSDTGWVWEAVFSGEPPWEDIDSYWRQSPLRYVGNVRTPTLIIHSENDLRCPIEQGEQLFTALKRLGVETELVRFPEEFHGLSRGGRTDRRISRLNHILRWFDRHLK